VTRLTGNERAIVVTALRHAAPYVRMFKNKIFVLKAGGEAFASAASTRSLTEQVAILSQVGFRIVLVHGGGPQLTALTQRLGHTPRIVDGRRVTDAQSLDAATMVLNGEINTRIVAAFRALGIAAIGLSGVDASLIDARKRPPVTRDNGEVIDYGFVGDIVSINRSVLLTQLDNGLIPVVSSLAADGEGTLLNINADTVAAAIASELEAEKLILATSAPGIMESLSDPRSLISYIDRAGLGRLRDERRISDGMLPKVAAIERALEGGVRRVHVISYAIPDSLLLEVFTNEGTGTLVVDNIEELPAHEQQG